METKESNNIKIINQYPLIREIENFLSAYECDDIISYAKDKLIEGAVIKDDGSPVIDKNYRDAYTSFVNKNEDNIVVNNILDKVSNFTGFDKKRFEALTIVKYTEGQEFKLHQDYFIPIDNPEHIEATKKRCAQGGNRVSTIILYLNDVESGGETYFPWFSTVLIKPKMGKLIQFDYGYDDWEANIRTQHAGLSVNKGEKWIATIWVREKSMDEFVLDYKTFYEENQVYSELNDITYKVECGPKSNVTNFEINLPANNHCMNSIVIGYTGGLDSTLLLYLLGILNNNLQIPYIIQHLCITSRLCDDPRKIEEPWEHLKLIHKMICDKVGGNIRDICYISAPKRSLRENQLDEGVNRYLMSHRNPSLQKEIMINEMGEKTYQSLVDHHKLHNLKYYFTAGNALPDDDDPRWCEINFQRKKPVHEYVVKPFYDLQKYHILDLYFKLNLEDLLDVVMSECSIKHSHVDDNCAFACNERRWAFKKINKIDYLNKFLRKEENMSKTHKEQPKMLNVGNIKKTKTTKKNETNTGPAPVTPPPTVG